MFLAFKEKQFAKRIIKGLLKSHLAVSNEKPGLSGNAFYREVLLHTKLVDSSDIDQLLWDAEDSIDEWTANATDALRLRQVAHFLIMSQHKESGHVGTVVSVKEIVYSLIPEDM